MSNCWWLFYNNYTRLKVDNQIILSYNISMKHLIKWMKISAGINLYLAIIATLLLIALMVDIGLDGYWRGTTTIMYETEPSQ